MYIIQPKDMGGVLVVPSNFYCFLCGAFLTPAPVPFVRFSVSGQCGLNHRMSYEQRKETDNSGTRSHRGAGVKHQGSGCSLGFFLQPPNSVARNGGRGKGSRGRGGRAKSGRMVRGDHHGSPLV